MPKAPVHENDFLSRRKRKVGFSGKLLVVKSVPVTKPMEQAPDSHLGTGVFTFYLGHECRSALGT